jgi:hypothetical protein
MEEKAGLQMTVDLTHRDLLAIFGGSCLSAAALGLFAIFWLALRGFGGTMPEHYTKNTLECTAWCARCQRDTQHRVDGGRRGPCLECQPRGMSKDQEARQKRLQKQRQQPGLFR